MKNLSCLLSVAMVLAAFSCLPAQEKLKPALASDPLLESMPSFSSHPEVWLYLQEQKRYDDPKSAVRRNAEFRADQRSHRLAAMKWFGYSNSRPTVSPTPTLGSYSPAWGGNSYNAYQWNGVGQTTVAVEVRDTDLRR